MTMKEISEGHNNLRKCDSCHKWYKDIDLCTTDETNKLECAECYLEWRMKLLKRKTK